APVVDPLLVLPTIAATIGAKDELREHLRAKYLLLLLDNLEQVLEVTPKLGELLAHAPTLKVLATSRERLSLAAEQEYVVPALPLKDAVELFVARARQLDAAFSADGAVAEICRRLDGLPLAVELAAARVKVLTPDQILSRLDRRFDVLRSTTRDAPVRQRTLRATIDWSYQLLDDEEKGLFVRLAVFAGSFDVDAAEVVAQADLGVLESLVDKSLLRRTHEGRFFMLETIREYGLEQLEDSPDRDEIHMRHAEHAIVRAAPASDDELLPWLARIVPEYADLLAALTWLADSESHVLLLQLASRLGRFWDGRSRLREGRRWLELALERGPATTTPERAEALSRLGHIAWRQGNLDAAAEAIGAAQAAAAELGDERLGAIQHMNRGAVAYSMGDLELASAEYTQAADTLRAVGDTRRLAIATHDLGLMALQRDDFMSSRKLVQESIQLSREDSYVAGESNALGTLGFIELGEGRVDRARELLLEALGLDRDIESLNLGTANNLVALAAIAAAENDFECACVFVGAYDAYRELIGASHEPFIRDLLERVLAQLEAHIGSSEIERARARGAELSLAEATDYALAQYELSVPRSP
ncbi:MAG: hypothetical protein M3P18_04950, partial [Actinomycetota bacterium]|nr:hypothetical protein [Actinomycetota bacterium]